MDDKQGSNPPGCFERREDEDVVEERWLRDRFAWKILRRRSRMCSFVDMITVRRKRL